MLTIKNKRNKEFAIKLYIFVHCLYNLVEQILWRYQVNSLTWDDIHYPLDI
jgi:hypothetical protein